MDTRDTKRVTLTLTLPVTVTVDVAAGPNGPEVVSVRDVAMPEAEEVMGALDHGRPVRRTRRPSTKKPDS